MISIQRIKPSSKLGGVLFFVVISLQCCISVVAAAGESLPATAEAQTAPCKGLKPYNNLDELLYQFYINMESDCLFKMSTAELEETWNIKILDDERAKPKNYYPLSETEFYNKPYKSEKDAFYVELNRHQKTKVSGQGDGAITITLKITKEYYEKYGSLFLGDKLPSALPKPKSYILDRTEIETPPCIFPRYSKIINSAPPPYCVFPKWEFNKNRNIISIMDRNQIKVRGYSEIRRNNYENRSDWTQNEISSSVDANTGTVPCRGLKSPENLDDLLYQFYINLDSDCLFKMSPSELEKIWDMKIISSERAGKGANLRELVELSKGVEFRGKPYDSEKDAFYVRIWERGKKDDSTVIQVKRNIFGIEMTAAFEDKYGSFFPDNKLPNLLPDPIIYRFPPLHRRRGEDATLYKYYWKNSAKTNEIELLGKGKFFVVR